MRRSGPLCDNDIDCMSGQQVLWPPWILCCRSLLHSGLCRARHAFFSPSTCCWLTLSSLSVCLAPVTHFSSIMRKCRNDRSIGTRCAPDTCVGPVPSLAPCVISGIATSRTSCPAVRSCPSWRSCSSIRLSSLPSTFLCSSSCWVVLSERRSARWCMTCSIRGSCC